MFVMSPQSRQIPNLKFNLQLGRRTVCVLGFIIYFFFGHQGLLFVIKYYLQQHRNSSLVSQFHLVCDFIFQTKFNYQLSNEQTAPVTLGGCLRKNNSRAFHFLPKLHKVSFNF